MNTLAVRKHLLRFIILLIVFTYKAEAQKFKYSIPGLDTIETFIVGGGSSTVLRNGQAEIISNNTLTSYWLAFHQTDKNSPIIDRFRRTLFNADLFAFYGVSATGRYDVGIQLKYVRSRFDNAATSSMFKVFEGESSGAADNNAIFDPTTFIDRSFGGLGSVGLRFRAIPILSVPELVVNGGYAISTVKDEVEQVQLGADRDIMDIGLTYFKKLNANAYYFFSGTGQIFFPSAVTDQSLYNTSASFFLIQRTTNQRFTFYPGLSYSLAFRPAELDSNPSLIRTADFLFAFGGIQYAPNAKYNIFLNGGFPLIANIKNPQQQIVRESYSVVSLGFRAGI